VTSTGLFHEPLSALLKIESPTVSSWFFILIHLQNLLAFDVS